MRYAVMSAAGNTFAVLDARRGRLPLEPAALAVELCSPQGAGAREGARALDGLLLALAPEAGGDCRMVIFNADGSRPEACGNGLRCVARFARENGFAAGDLLRVETDCGTREVELLREGGAIAGARARMGVPRVSALDRELDAGGERVRATLVDMGNPHCVLFVEDEELAPVGRLGPAIERHPSFPKGTNVEFVAVADGGLRVRVWERGVGETAACGTGACAAAVAARCLGRIELPARVRLRGGVLAVGWDGRGEVEMTGPCEHLGQREWRPPETGR